MLYMDIFALSPAKDIPILYLGIGCILMAVLGGFTSEFNVIVSVKQVFSILLRSFFVGVLAFFMGMSVKIPWWLKLFFAGLFGFIGIPSILILVKNVMSNMLSLIQNFDEIFSKAESNVKPEHEDNESE